MADFPGLPAFAGPVVDSTPIPMGDGVFSRDGTAEQLAAYMATKNGNATPLVRWNETDLTQFDDAQTPPAPAINSGVTTPAFSGAGGFISVGAAALAPNAIGVWWLDGEYALEDIEEIRFFVAMTIPTLGDEVKVGIAFIGDLAVGTYFAWTTGYDATGAPIFTMGRADAPGGALIEGGASGGTGYFTMKLKGTAGGAYPSFLWQWEMVEIGGNRTDDVMSSGYIHNAISPFPASWNGVASNKLGIVIQSSAGAVNPVSAILADITVKRRQAA